MTSTPDNFMHVAPPTHKVNYQTWAEASKQWTEVSKQSSISFLCKP